MRTKRICDGVDLRILENTKFKTNTLSLFFHIPLKRETVTMAALLPSVLKRGTQKYPKLSDMARHLADLYSASCSAGVRMKGDGEVLYVTMEYIADTYIGENLTVQVLDFLREFVFSPKVENGGFLPEYVESEKENLRESILGLINDKKEYADSKCREAMFGADGYGMFEAGYVEDLDGITPEKLYGFYQELLQTAKVDVFLGGTVTDQVEDQVISVLDEVLSPRCATYPKTEPALSKRQEPQMVVEEMQASQSKISMGLCCGVNPTEREYYALMLGSCIFGGSPFSKLFNNVREKLSLAYYAAARTDRLKSVMMISSGIQTENFQAAYDEIMVQLGKMQRGEIEDAELMAAKKYLENGLRSMEDSLRAKEDYYLSQAILGQEQSLEELLSCLTRVTKEEIVAVMEKVTLDTVYFLKGSGGEEEA
ncbi:MAG: insulinase family protein [Clostridia bacterium]|nr:insulinase family protein [Clostridia bacterium]